MNILKAFGTIALTSLMATSCATTKSSLSSDGSYKVAVATKPDRRGYCDPEKDFQKCLEPIRQQLDELSKAICRGGKAVESICVPDSVNNSPGISCTGKCTGLEPRTIR